MTIYSYNIFTIRFDQIQGISWCKSVFILIYQKLFRIIWWSRIWEISYMNRFSISVTYFLFILKKYFLSYLLTRLSDKNSQYMYIYIYWSSSWYWSSIYARQNTVSPMRKHRLYPGLYCTAGSALIHMTEWPKKWLDDDLKEKFFGVCHIDHHHRWFIQAEDHDA